MTVYINFIDIWILDKSDDSGQEPGSVNITEWWRQMEMKTLEVVVFKDARIEPVSISNENCPLDSSFMPSKCCSEY